MYAEALWDHVTMNEEELCFTAGQAIAVYDVDDPEWWFGLADDHIGWFPAAFVRVSFLTVLSTRIFITLPLGLTQN
jgi:Rho guanine nucleotide exchange factor 4